MSVTPRHFPTAFGARPGEPAHLLRAHARPLLRLNAHAPE